ncbi:hypothetical protein [Streptomyces sp. NPDC047315]|uniref:hypothetical protein n=1 Tax=Streptomyces sp. NPDC047315 TaxID=3155142 RepID=UPI0033F5412F
MDGNLGADRDDSAIDWLDCSPDLPHLFARISELVFRHGLHPSDLVVLPRAEVDRRETAAFTAGWADAVAEELPGIRLSYEKLIADAYAQGQLVARGVRVPRRTDVVRTDGAQVIALPFARLMEPPDVVVHAEERAHQERAHLNGLAQAREPADEEPHRSDGWTARPVPAVPPVPPVPAEPAPEPVPDVVAEEAPVLLTAREVRERQAARIMRKVLRGKRGRPIVPPLAPLPPQVGGGRRPEGTAREGKGEQVGQVEQVDRVERAERVERVVRAKRVKRVERVEQVERVERVERVTPDPPPEAAP